MSGDTAIAAAAAAQASRSTTLPAGQTTKTGAAGSAQLVKLQKAAGEFESMLLASLWKSMKETFSDPDDPDVDPTLKSFDDWSIQAMSSAVGNAGGLGIKGLILKYLEPTLVGAGPGGAAK